MGDLLKVWEIFKNSSNDKDMQRAFSRAVTSNACIEVLEENDELKEQVEQLKEENRRLIIVRNEKGEELGVLRRKVVDLQEELTFTNNAFNELEANEQPLRKRIGKLELHGNRLKEDLLLRAARDADGMKVVNVSNSIWVGFCTALRGDDNE